MLARNLFFSVVLLGFPYFQFFVDQMILLLVVVFFGIKYFYNKYIGFLHSFLLKREVLWRTNMYFLSLLCCWTSIYYISFYGKRILALSYVAKWASKAMAQLKKTYHFILISRMKQFNKNLIDTEKYWLVFSKHKIYDMISNSYLKNNTSYLLINR